MTALEEINEIGTPFAHHEAQFIDGSIAMAAEVVALKRELSNCKNAISAHKKRRTTKNYPLQAGGVLTVAEARQMVVQRQEDEVAKARRLAEAADNKVRIFYKNQFSEAAKVARK